MRCFLKFSKMNNRRLSPKTRLYTENVRFMSHEVIGACLNAAISACGNRLMTDSIDAPVSKI